MPQTTERFSALAQDMKGSEIIQIAGEVRARKAEGQDIADLTVGDFDPKLFPIPAELTEMVIAQYRAGATNYPPAVGELALRKALSSYMSSRFGLDYSVQEILVGGGARPLLYSVYAAVVDAGDTVVYPVPSWNNSLFTHMVGGRPAEIATLPENRFLLTAKELEPHLSRAVLVVLTSPGNPSGTMYEESELRAICEMILAENQRRAPRGAKPVYLMYDQIYQELRYSEHHHHPLHLVPDLRDYTIYVDGATKSLAATGLRVGWMTAPEDLIRKTGAILGVIGAWSPKAEQLGLAEYLSLPDPQRQAFRAAMDAKVVERLKVLYDGLIQLKAEGLPVTALPPQGGLYLSVQFDILGKTTLQGRTLANSTDLYLYLLEDAQLAVVPFHAFGVKEATGWCRCSVGAVSVPALEAMLDRLRTSLQQLR